MGPKITQPDVSVVAIVSLLILTVAYVVTGGPHADRVAMLAVSAISGVGGYNLRKNGTNS